MRVMRFMLLCFVFLTAIGYGNAIEFKIIDPGPTVVGQSPAIGQVRILLDIESQNAFKGMQAFTTVTRKDPSGGYYKDFTLPNSHDMKPFTSKGNILKLTYVEELLPTIRRYEFWFHLDANVTSTHENNMSGDELWRIKTPFNILAACIQTMYVDENGESQYLSGTEGFTTQPAGLIDNLGNPWSGSSDNYRPPIAVAMVLDKSGSMDWDSGSGGRKRIEVLRDAVEDLVYEWSLTDVSMPGDQVGIVFFDTTASWWSNLPANLNDFDSSHALIADGDTGTFNDPIKDPIRGVDPGGWTSIGGGVLLAANALGSSSAEHKVILVFSDGEQNREPFIAVEQISQTKHIVYTHALNDPGYSASKKLPNHDDLQIYTITTGPAATIPGQINMDIAVATNGFYLNTEASSEQIRIFFLEIFQNFLRYNTVETSLITTGSSEPTQPHELEFSVAGGTKWFVFNLVFDRSLGVMKVTLTPPGKGPRIEAAGRGSICLRPELAEIAPLKSFAGTWHAKVEVLETAGETKQIPFNITVHEDNVALKSEFEVAQTGLKPGGKIHVTARAKVLGSMVTGLGADPAGQVTVRLVKPGESIGDLLAASTASTQPPVPGDSLVSLDAGAAAAEAKLANALKADPDFLKLVTNEYPLKDDGAGNYETDLPIDVAGHYTMMVTIKGNDPDLGKFSRQQVKTVYVTAFPDGAKTLVNASAAGGTFNVKITPKTKLGHKLGPGWANRLWFKTDNGQIAKPKDNGDGTYSAAFSMVNDKQPMVDLFFIGASVLIGDETPPDKLPVPLDEKSLLIKDIGGKAGTPAAPAWIWILVVGLLVVGALLMIMRNRS